MRRGLTHGMSPTVGSRWWLAEVKVMAPRAGLITSGRSSVLGLKALIAPRWEVLAGRCGTDRVPGVRRVNEGY